MSNNIGEKNDIIAVVVGFFGILFSAILAWVVYIFSLQQLGFVMEIICAIATFGLGVLFSLVGAFSVSFLGQLEKRIDRIEKAVVKTEDSFEENLLDMQPENKADDTKQYETITLN